MRCAQTPLGLSHLNADDRRLVNLGNSLSKRSAEVAQLCEELRIPLIEENPAGSFLWLVHGRLARAQKEHWRTVIVDQCSCGRPYRKRTRFDVLFADEVLLSQLPRCVNRLCTFTGKKHVVLGLGATSAAAEYPVPLASRIARTLVTCAKRKEAEEIWCKFQNPCD